MCSLDFLSQLQLFVEQNASDLRRNSFYLSRKNETECEMASSEVSTLTLEFIVPDTLMHKPLQAKKFESKQIKFDIKLLKFDYK